MENFDFNVYPKKFIEQTVFGLGKEHFTLAIREGVGITCYAMTLSQMKLTCQQMIETIAQYERMYHKIEDAASSGIPSTVMSDLTDKGSVKPPQDDEQDSSKSAPPTPKGKR